jgi:hypothetical protein
MGILFSIISFIFGILLVSGIYFEKNYIGLLLCMLPFPYIIGNTIAKICICKYYPEEQ